MGWDPVKKIFLQWIKRDKINFSKKETEIVHVSYNIYKERTLSSFKLLDSIKGENVYRVYPHKLFCDTIVKNRCIANYNKELFYKNNNHPSYRGAEMINDLIMKEIEKIENESN